MSTIFLDVGETTGWCLLSSDGTLFYGSTTTISRLNDFIQRFDVKVAVIEQIQTHSNIKFSQLTLEKYGAAKVICAMKGVKIVFQVPGYMVGPYKRHNLMISKLQVVHCRDAFAHLIAYLGVDFNESLVKRMQFVP